mgnify:CR=1 FL=1
MTTPTQLVQNFYTALSIGDTSAIMTILDPDLKWTEAERFPYYGGMWNSPQAVIENLLVPLSREWEDFSAKPNDFIAQDNQVVALGTYSGTYKQTGNSMSSPFAHVWKVRDERLSHFKQYTDTAKVLEALQP